MKRFQIRDHDFFFGGAILLLAVSQFWRIPVLLYIFGFYCWVKEKKSGRIITYGTSVPPLLGSSKEAQTYFFISKRLWTNVCLMNSSEYKLPVYYCNYQVIWICRRNKMTMSRNQPPGTNSSEGSEAQQTVWRIRKIPVNLPDPDLNFFSSVPIPSCWMD